MAEKATGTTPSESSGNFGVPVGAVIVFVCFFLPWTVSGRSSAMEIAVNLHGKTASTLANLSLYIPGSWARLLWLIPIVALAALALEVVAPAGRPGRMVARLVAFAGGAVLCNFFVSFGIAYGARLAYGFWGSLTGALFLTVGAMFNVYRGE